MSTELSQAWHSRSHSTCLDFDWDRCVKRKHNDGSGKLLRGHTIAKKEGGNCSFSRDATWGIMPSITDIHKAIIPLTSRSCAPLLQDHPRQTPYIQNDERAVFSKKRFHIATGVEASPGTVHTCDKDTENEVLRLKEALKFEKRALRKLHRDLADERCASSTAADETMAMITRLQEEKAAALVESWQYKRASEEREAYNQEAIALLKEALSIKEQEYLSLQDHIENFRSAFREMKSGWGLIEMIEIDHLECGKESAQLRLLEGKEAASCSLVESECAKVDLNESCETGDGEYHKSMHWHPAEESVLQEQMYEDVETNLQRDHGHSDTLSDEQDLDDVSRSILNRIARLEERFARLGHNQALDLESLEPALHSTAEDCLEEGFAHLGHNQALDLESLEPALHSTAEDCGKQDPGSKPINNIDVLGSTQLKSSLVAGNCKDLSATDCKCEHCLSAVNLNNTTSRKYPASLSKPSDDRGPSCLGSVDVPCEEVHELYEVQFRPDDSAMPSLCYTNQNNENGFRGRDCLINHSEQDFKNDEVNGFTSGFRHHFPLEDDAVGYNASLNNPIAADIFSGDEAVKSSVTTEDLQHLKLRLWSLERERAIMKEAIESLRKENTELKLLEEIANRLQELKGSGGRDQLPFLSFFKGILSFTGIQSLSSSQEGRWQGNLQTSPNKQEHGGLLHLLNNSLGKENVVHVTRERKVKLGTT